METYDAIRLRRSVRRYDSAAIPREMIQEILEDACWAPSGDNFQPWFFLALTEKDKREQLEAIMQRVSLKLRPTLERIFAGHPEVITSTTDFLGNMGAPVYILVFLRKDYGDEREQSMMSAAAAMENLLLSARAHELGTCWIYAAITVGAQEEIRRAFAPDRGELLGIITLGRPAITPKAPPRKPDRWAIQ